MLCYKHSLFISFGSAYKVTRKLLCAAGLWVSFANPCLACSLPASRVYSVKRRCESACLRQVLPAQRVFNSAAVGLSSAHRWAAGHNYIGTEHILMGLLREGEGVAARVLETLGADQAKIRTQVRGRVGCSPVVLQSCSTA